MPYLRAARDLSPPFDNQETPAEQVVVCCPGCGRAGGRVAGRRRSSWQIGHCPFRHASSSFPGVDYARDIHVQPRPIITHVITIDMRTGGLRLLVTPADDRGSDLPLRARTTSEFLQEFDVQIAINGDGFSPWWSRGVADYYPHSGDPVRPRGDAASRGRVYWSTPDPFPTLYINSRNKLSFEAPGQAVQRDFRRDHAGGRGAT